MILYHFTPVENVETIKRDGLQASAGIDDDMVGSGTSIVYLCDTPTIEATDAEMEMYRQHFPEQLVSKRWLRPQDSEPMARFTIRLPSHDRKLKQYGQWHRANYHLIDGLPDPRRHLRKMGDRYMVALLRRHRGVEDQGMHNRGSHPLSARSPVTARPRRWRCHPSREPLPVEIPNIPAFANRVIPIVMRPHDDAQRPPACEKCQREMTLLGRLPAIGIRQALSVYRCLPCQCIATTHD
jgi:hypothetical protein